MKILKLTQKANISREKTPLFFSANKIIGSMKKTYAESATKPMKEPPKNCIKFGKRPKIKRNQIPYNNKVKYLPISAIFTKFKQI